LFCVYDGRDNVVVGGERKRKQRTTVQVFSKPFKTDKYRSHLKQHKRWAEYDALSDIDKATFFKASEQLRKTLPYYIDRENDTIKFVIAAPIVETIISKLFFDATSATLVASSDEDSDLERSNEILNARAAAKIQHQSNVMKIFKKVEGATV
jgi:hypothetical protein